MPRRRGSRLKRNFHVLKALFKSKPKRRKELLASADSDLVHSLCDCSKNVLNGNVPLSSSRKKQLKRHRKLLRTLADSSVPFGTRSRIIKKQRGGFLPLIPALLAPILGIVGNLIGDAISK
jgi:hypothetical protein